MKKILLSFVVGAIIIISVFTLSKVFSQNPPVSVQSSGDATPPIADLPPAR